MAPIAHQAGLLLLSPARERPRKKKKKGEDHRRHRQKKKERRRVVSSRRTERGPPDLDFRGMPTFLLFAALLTEGGEEKERKKKERALLFFIRRRGRETEKRERMKKLAEVDGGNPICPASKGKEGGALFLTGREKEGGKNGFAALTSTSACKRRKMPTRVCGREKKEGKKRNHRRDTPNGTGEKRRREKARH